MGQEEVFAFALCNIYLTWVDNHCTKQVTFGMNALHA